MLLINVSQIYAAVERTARKVITQQNTFATEVQKQPEHHAAAQMGESGEKNHKFTLWTRNYVHTLVSWESYLLILGH